MKKIVSTCIVLLSLSMPGVGGAQDADLITLLDKTVSHDGCQTGHSLVLDSANHMRWEQSQICGDETVVADVTEFSHITTKTWLYILSKARDMVDAQGDGINLSAVELFSWENDIKVALMSASEGFEIVVTKASSNGMFAPLVIGVNEESDILFSMLHREYFLNKQYMG